MSGSTWGKQVARLLFEANAIHVSRSQPYILAAGWASPVYVDCRLLMGERATGRAVTQIAADYLASRFAPGSLDAIAGAETASIPFAAWLADQTAAKLRYVRKHPLGIGRNAQVEGGSVDGLSVLLMDDLTTDGTSKLAFARGLRAAGARVEHVLTIFYHDAFPGARARLGDAGLELHALSTWDDVLSVEGSLEAEDRASIVAFLADPVGWSARHGGRVSLDARS